MWLIHFLSIRDLSWRSLHCGGQGNSWLAISLADFFLSLIHFTFNLFFNFFSYQKINRQIGVAFMNSTFFISLQFFKLFLSCFFNFFLFFFVLLLQLGNTFCRSYSFQIWLSQIRWFIIIHLICSIFFYLLLIILLTIIHTQPLQNLRLFIYFLLLSLLIFLIVQIKINPCVRNSW